MALKPYYDNGQQVIYHGDCREVLPLLPQVDLVLTDPPYGIGMDGGSVGYRGDNVFDKLDWDKERAPANILADCRHISSIQIIWGGNYYADVLPASRSWLVWDKGAGFKGRSYAEAELAWTSVDGNARIFARDPLACGDYHGKTHPCMKPVHLMLWCIEWSKTTGKILDPFMGSGTTLVAAKLLDRECIGIEREEKYCEIAARRLENTTPSLFSEAVNG